MFQETKKFKCSSKFSTEVVQVNRVISHKLYKNSLAGIHRASRVEEPGGQLVAMGCVDLEIQNAGCYFCSLLMA